MYKLTIGSYYYIGITDTTIRNRYSGHKRSCFNRRKKTYHQKIYKTIRKEMCRILKKTVSQLTKKDFSNLVIVKQVAVINTSRKDLLSLERELINLNNVWCLNSIQ